MCTVRTSFSPRKFRISTLSFSSVMLMEMGKWAYTKRILYSKPFVTPLIRFCSSKRIAVERLHNCQGPPADAFLLHDLCHAFDLFLQTWVCTWEFRQAESSFTSTSQQTSASFLQFGQPGQSLANEQPDSSFF